MAQVNRPTKLIIKSSIHLQRFLYAATDSLCIFAFFGYDTPPSECDYGAPTGPGRTHVNGPGRAQNCGRENGPGRAGPGCAGPGRGISARADL